jgi:DNA (cytosine-5)-methyltransferase 1
MKKTPTFIDLFCGLGAFRVAFEKVGFKCVFSSDINKKIQEVYESNFGDKPASDITTVDPKSIPDFDILTAGFPCQPFSICGKQMGFKDTRGTLFFSICQIIKEKQPKVVILENVKHIVVHDKKRTLSVILNSLSELGYNVTYKVLNAINFGLPQNRERVFIVATKNKPFDFSSLKQQKSDPLKNFLDKKGNFSILDKKEYTLLDTGLFKRQEASGLIFRGYRNKNQFQRGVRPNTQHLNRVHRQFNRIYSVDGYHPTLPSQESSGRFFIYIPEQDLVRKLTIDECYRIMGYAASYKRSEKISDQYKQLGNSIAINVVNAIASELIKQKILDDEPCSKIRGNIQKSVNEQFILNI